MGTALEDAYVAPAHCWRCGDLLIDVSIEPSCLETCKPCAEYLRSEAKHQAQGRPTKCTPETIERILISVRYGNYMTTAARLAGVNPEQASRWIAGKAPFDREPFTSFAQGIAHADAVCEGELVTGIVATARRAFKAGDTRPAENFLATKFKKRWGKTIRQELSGPEGAPIRTGVVMLPPEVPTKAGAELPELETVSESKGPKPVPLEERNRRG